MNSTNVQITDLSVDMSLTTLDEVNQRLIVGGGWENDGVFDSNDAAIVDVLIGETPNPSNLWQVTGLSRQKIGALNSNTKLKESLYQKLPDVARYLFG